MRSDRAPSSADAFAVLGRRLDAYPCTPPLRAWLARHWRYDEHEPDDHPYHIRLSSACPDPTTAPSIDEPPSPDSSPPFPRPRPAPASLARRSPFPVGEQGGSPDSAGAKDVRAVDVRLPGDFTLHWITQGGEWRNGDEAAGVHGCFDAGESRIAVWGTTNAAARTGALARIGAGPPWPALYVALCEALRASGLIPLHAAVVVRGHHAIALTGPSGIGKTTTLLRLLERGWRPLAEDLSWLEPASRTLYGWDRGLRLWPDGVARLGRRVAAAPWTVDGDGKRRLDWSAVPAARVAQATLTRVVVLERDGTRPSSITRLSRPAAVRVLWEATGVPLTPWVRDEVARHIARLARTLEHVRLTIGAGDLPEPDTVLCDG